MIDDLLKLIEERLEDIHTSLPGKVLKFNASTGNADVQIQSYRPDITPPVLKDIRVVYPQSSKYSVTFPLEPGDHCEVRFSELQLVHWRQANGEAREVTDYKPHTFDGAYVVPGLFPDSKTATIATDGLIIKSPNHSIKVTESDGVEVDGDLKVTGAITTTGDVTSDGDITINGSLTVNGSISATLEITAMNASPLTKVTVSQHKHATLGSPPTPGT